MTLFLKPAPGRIVRDPVTMTPIPPDGEEKPRDPHWLRRLHDGDVVEALPPEHSTEEADQQ